MLWFIGLLILFMASVPIGIALVAVGLGFLAAETSIPLVIAAQRSTTGLDSFALIAIPFFLLAAELMNRTGITDRLFRLANALVGHVTGGLGHVNIVASMLFASMSGSAVSDAVGLGRIEIRTMKAAGYDTPFAAAITAASTTIAPILPPSISLVIYGVTSEASIGGLFLAGLLPGVLMGIALMIMVSYYARKRGYPKSPPSTWKEKGAAFSESFLALLTPVIVVGGIWTGAFTASEAGAVAVLYALILGGVIYRSLSMRQLADVLFESALSAANVLFIIAVSAVVAWVLTIEQVPLNMAAAILDLSPHPVVFLLFLNAILLVLGCFIAAAPVIIMVTPIIMPATTAMGIDPIHLGVVMVLNLMIGLITPPVGLCLFAVSEVANISPVRLMRALLPFFIPLLAVLIVITVFPWFTLFLPRLFGFVQ